MSARSRIHDSVAAETATSTREQRAGTRSTRPRHDWERLVLEIVVVVAGILIAFALDSWWDSRGEAARERAHLRALRGDFVQNVERLDQAAARQEGIVRASRQLLALSRTDGPVAVDSVRSLVGRVLNSGRFGPVMGAYEAVVNTGGLAQIRDDSLRSALAEFASNLGVRYTEEYSNSLYFPFIREYAGRLGFLWNDRPADGSDPTSLQSEDREFLELLRDPRFQGQVALRAYAESDVAGYYRGLQQQAERILALLDQQLGDGERRRPAAGARLADTTLSARLTFADGDRGAAILGEADDWARQLSDFDRGARQRMLGPTDLDGFLEFVLHGAGLDARRAGSAEQPLRRPRLRARAAGPDGRPETRTSSRCCRSGCRWTR